MSDDQWTLVLFALMWIVIGLRYAFLPDRVEKDANASWKAWNPNARPVKPYSPRVLKVIRIVGVGMALIGVVLLVRVL